MSGTIRSSRSHLLAMNNPVRTFQGTQILTTTFFRISFFIAGCSQ
ncbi:MAG: hypothetical protein OJF51_001424 [Nitrospira sp.]|jgi:hypothetical protein|nr:MAG: hypothetical protein OJF51_001424 [Nitrospira sp.]